MVTFCVLQLDGTVAQCPTPRISTQDCPFIDLCRRASQLTDSASSHTAKVALKDPCPVILAPLHFPENFVQPGPNSRWQPQGRISSLILKVLIRNTGYA